MSMNNLIGIVSFVSDVLIQLLRWGGIGLFVYLLFLGGFKVQFFTEQAFCMWQEM